MKNFNVISIADIHFGKKDDYRLNTEIEDFLNTIKEIQNNPDEENIDMIIILGDLYDRVIKMNEPTSSYIINFINELCEFTEKNSIIFRIIKGTKTHDFNQLNVFKKLETVYSKFRIIDSVEEEEIVTNDFSDVIRILYLPEEYPENIYQYYAEYFNKEYDLIFGHGMIDFVAYTGNEEDMSERPVRNAPVFKSEDLMNICSGPIVFGHVHDYHEYKDKIYYVGSYSRFSFADQEDKGFLYIHYNIINKKFEIDFYQNDQAPTYYILSLDKLSFDSLDDLNNYIKSIKKQYDYVKIKANKDIDNIDLIKSLVASDESIKMEIKNIDFEEDKVDEQFKFILNREFDLPTTIKRYLIITKDKDLPLEEIKNIIKPE